jgi:rare lipoprotein A (peptidoglycan hydrolase)
VEDLRTTRARGRVAVVAIAAVSMLGAPIALLHGGAATKAATALPAPRGRASTGRADPLGKTQLVASSVPKTTPLQRARHRAAVRHAEEVANAHARLRAEHLHTAAVRTAEARFAHDSVVSSVLRRHDAAVRAAEARSRANRAAAARHRAAVTAAESARSREGIATWYAWHPGQCASPFLPHGTLLTVTDLTTHKTIQCLVTDTEAHNPGRVVDLSNWCFEQLAPLSQGVIEVRITW